MYTFVSVEETRQPLNNITHWQEPEFDYISSRKTGSESRSWLGRQIDEGEPVEVVDLEDVAKPGDEVIKKGRKGEGEREGGEDKRGLPFLHWLPWKTSSSRQRGCMVKEEVIVDDDMDEEEEDDGGGGCGDELHAWRCGGWIIDRRDRESWAQWLLSLELVFGRMRKCEEISKWLNLDPPSGPTKLGKPDGSISMELGLDFGFKKQRIV